MVISSFLTLRDDGSKLPVHFRHDGSSMTYAAQNSAKIPWQRPKSAMAGIVESALDIALVTAGGCRKFFRVNRMVIAASDFAP